LVRRIAVLIALTAVIAIVFLTVVGFLVPSSLGGPVGN
jgi:hypothetical protein